MLPHFASIGIKALTYPSLMANQRDSNHYNNDGSDDVNNPVLTRAKFLEFHKEARDENQQFREMSQQIIGEIKQMIATLLARNHLTTTMIYIFNNALLTIRKFHSLTEICVSWILLTGFLIWENILIFGRFVMKKKCYLHLINWTMNERNNGKIFKSIESNKLSVQFALDKE